MDYQILHLKVVSVSRFWIEVEGNKLDQRSVWVSREAVNFNYWTDFLLNVFSVEPLNYQDNLLRIKPMSHTSPITHEAPLGYAVLEVKGEWLKVSVIPDDMSEQGEEGWIRWKKDGNWLIRYNMLS